MEKESKTKRTKSEVKGKPAKSRSKSPSENSNLDEKFQTWKKKAKASVAFPFLDNYLFSEYVSKDHHKSQQDLADKSTTPKTNGVNKYYSLIKYIEQHSESDELEKLLHNITFIYGIDKEVIKKEALSNKKAVKKAPKNIAIDQYLKTLIENDVKKPSEPAPPKSKAATKSKKSENANQTGIDLKEISGVDDLKILEKKTKSNKKPNGKTKVFKDDGNLDESLDEVHPVKKKLKDHSSTGREVVIGDDSEVNDKALADSVKLAKVDEVKKNGASAKSRKNKDNTTAKKKKKVKKYDSPSSSDDEEVKEDIQEPEQGPEEYMELHINNDIDSDDGEGFSFFFVNDNIYNKTKPYFEKKLKPEQICSCVGGCNDPTICPCARYNFENCGKTACYVYDAKLGKKRLINHLIRKDMHIYECSSQCACNKSLCFNSCINEGETNKANPKDFIIERYNKLYLGQDNRLENFGAKMWGLKAGALIPANTYVVEYCGEIITKKEGDRRGEKYDSVNCNYLFDLNKHAEIESIDQASNTITLNIDGVCETRKISKLKDIAKNFPLVIDAFFYGNHSRFVNHSCDPNMVAIAVHTENRNILLPRIIYFALRDIQPGEELTIDYNCAPLKDLKNTDQLVCLCGAASCRGYVYEEGEDE